MKKIMMLVLVMWAAGAYSQEIRMPDEKRKDYVDEREKDNSPANTTTKEQSELNAERRKQAELERKKRAAATGDKSAAKGISVYCIIQEMSEPGARNSKVSINVEEGYEKHVKKMDEVTQKHVMMAIEKRSYSSGLEALSTLTQSKWSLVESSVYSFQDMAVREYLMEYQLPLR